MLGILGHGGLPHWPGLWMLAAGVCLPGAVWRPARVWGALALGAALFFSGLAAGQLEAFYYPADHLGQFATESPRLASLELRLSHPPRLLNPSDSAPRPTPPRQVALAEVVGILTRRGWESASGQTLLQIEQPCAELAEGQRLRATGFLGRPMAGLNPGQFDWAGYYRQQRILTSFHVAYPQQVQILEDPGPGLLGRLRQGARRAMEMGFGPARAVDHALLRALVLGDPDPQLRDVQEQFVRTGTSHHLAISGMHIALIGALVFGVCRLLLIGPRWATWVGLGAVLLYGILVLPSPPVVRSVLLCLAFAVGVLGRRSVDGIQLLALSVFLMLIYQPLDLFGAGFQLSFGTVLGFMLFTRPVLEYLASWRSIHEQVAMAIQRPTPLRRFTLAVRVWMIRAVLAGGIAFLVSAPLVAWHFNQCNPWTIAASLLLAGPVFLALTFGVMKIVLTLMLPSLAPLLAVAAAGPVGMMRQMVEWLGRLPGSEVPLPGPSAPLLVVYYLLLCLPLLPRPGWLGRLGAALRWAPLGCLPLLVLPWLAGRESAAGSLRLTLLAVGGGQCAVVHLPSGKTVLIDAGSGSIADVGRSCIIPYLKQQGVGRIDRAFVSHPNLDHFSGLAQTLGRLGGGEVHVSPHFSGHARGNGPAEELLRELEEMGCAMKPVAAGSRVELDGQTLAEVIWPPADDQMEVNDASLVIRLSYAGRSILFTGDIGQEPMRQLLANPAALAADVLIAPHHGSSEPATADFLQTVNPQAVLASNGKKLSAKQADFDTLAGSRPLYRTHRCGAVRVEVLADGRIRVEGFVKGR